MSILATCVVPHPPIILPEVGRGEERKIQKTIDSYDEVMRIMASFEPESIILTSPHSVMYSDYFHISPGKDATGDMGSFHASGTAVRVRYDTELVTEISRVARAKSIAAGTQGQRTKELDHGTIIPLYFLNKFMKKDYRVVRIGLSGFPSSVHYELGQCITKAVDNLRRRAIFIASGDLSHKLRRDGPYGFAKEGPIFDEKIIEAFKTADFYKLLSLDETFCEKAAECGLKSFQIMAGALDGKSVEAKVYSHEGTFGVGYLTATFIVSGDDDSRCFLDIYRRKVMDSAREKAEHQDAFVRLARAAVEKVVCTGKRLTLSEVENEIGNDKESSFSEKNREQATRMGEKDKAVSCSEAGSERDINLKGTNSQGLGGEYSQGPEGKRDWINFSIPSEMLERRAGVFVTLHKEGQLRGCIGTISATTQSIAEEILQNAVSACRKDPRFDPVRPEELPYLEYSVDVLGDAEKIRSERELDVKKYGVIVTNGYRRGLLLPDLDGVDTPGQQISIAKRKAGIGEYESVELERFEVIRHL